MEKCLLTVAVGGYGQGSGQQELSYIINENGNNFVGVTIQYRVSEERISEHVAISDLY